MAASASAMVVVTAMAQLGAEVTGARIGGWSAELEALMVGRLAALMAAVAPREEEAGLRGGAQAPTSQGQRAGRKSCPCWNRP